MYHATLRHSCMRLDASRRPLHPHSSLLTPAVWAAECTDTDLTCWFWASTDQCALNPGYMLFNCKTACRVPLCVGTDGENESRPDSVGY